MPTLHNWLLSVCGVLKTIRRHISPIVFFARSLSMQSRRFNRIFIRLFQYNTVQYSTVQYSTVQYNTVPPGILNSSHPPERGCAPDDSWRVRFTER